MTDLKHLQFLLERIHSYESCSQILAETYKLFGEPDGWFFRQLHQSVLALIDDPDTFYGVSEDNASPVLQAIAPAGLHGVAAIELGDHAELQAAARELSSATEA